MSVLLNIAPVRAAIAGLSPYAAVVMISVKTQLLDQAKAKDTSQVINGISNILQKLLRCFNGTTILRSCITLLLSLSLFSVFSTRQILYLNDAEFVIGYVL